MLAQTLQGLEADGFVDRVSYPVIPPHVEYSLTSLGQDVASQVESLVDWIEINLHHVMQARSESTRARRVQTASSGLDIRVQPTQALA